MFHQLHYNGDDNLPPNVQINDSVFNYIPEVKLKDCPEEGCDNGIIHDTDINNDYYKKCTLCNGKGKVEMSQEEIDHDKWLNKNEPNNL